MKRFFNPGPFLVILLAIFCRIPALCKGDIIIYNHMKIKPYLSFWLIITCNILAGWHCSGQTLSGEYLGQTPPGNVPVKFAPGFISTAAHEFSCSLSPDGKEFYFTRRDPVSGQNFVMVTQMENSQWTHPQKASFTGLNPSFEAMVTANGSRIYFMMSDPLHYNGAWSVFYVAKNGNTWGIPQDPGALFNPMKTMFCTADMSGNLYTTDISRGPGMERIMFSTPDQGVYNRFSLCPDPINLNAKDMYPCISRDGKVLVFNSSRSVNSGKSGLFVSHLTEEGNWGDPIELDLGMQAGLPFLSFDGKYLFFSAGPNLSSDIYWVSADILGNGVTSTPSIPLGSKIETGLIYPNPCTQFTNLSLTLVESGRVEIDLFSIHGQLVSQVLRKTMDPGHANLTLDVSRYSPGTFLLRVAFNGAFQCERVLIINH
jgi:hypothetical protein